MGVGQKTRAWRFTDLNKDYTVCVVSLDRKPPGQLIQSNTALPDVSC